MFGAENATFILDCKPKERTMGAFEMILENAHALVQQLAC